jgi:hypothetical protein
MSINEVMGIAAAMSALTIAIALAAKRSVIPRLLSQRARQLGVMNVSRERVDAFSLIVAGIVLILMAVVMGVAIARPDGVAAVVVLVPQAGIGVAMIASGNADRRRYPS